MAENSPFTSPEMPVVFTLERIVRGESPILMVKHDESDGGWLFLDGGELDLDESTLVEPETITKLDPSVLELASLPLGWVATRDKPGDPWELAADVLEEDDEVDFLAEMEEFGWNAVLISEDEEGPAFGYSVGLFQRFEHPEVVMFGLPLEALNDIINVIGEEVEQGRRFSDGDIASGILDQADVLFRKVAPEYYAEHFGHGRLFYKGDDFPVLQCLWPDREGRFPTDPEFSSELRSRQPLLFE